MSQMSAEYTDVRRIDGEEKHGQTKVVRLPFQRVSARAIIIRRSDGSVVGTLHRLGGKYALPGGAPEDGESTYEAVVRELEEEEITLVRPGSPDESDMVVDYFAGYGELSVWYIFLVEDALIGAAEENIESRWVSQDEDVWYPGMREKLLLEILARYPELTQRRVRVE